MVYSETAIYFGIISLILVIVSLLSLKKDQNFQLRFFSFVFAISLLLIFENPLSKLIYTFKVPVLSTTYATRMSLLLTFSAAFLVAYGLEKIQTNKSKVWKTTIFIMAGFVGVLGSLYLCVDILKKANLETNSQLLANYSVALRNSFVPMMVVGAFCLALVILRNKIKILYMTIFFLICLDILRFSLKFNVFSPNHLSYPKTPVIKFLMDNTNNSRFERERSEVMPPMSWMPYHLYSASGYDPLYPKQYAQFFNIVNEAKYTDSFTRYAEIDHLNSKFLDFVGAKYIVVAKRDKNNVIDSKVDTISSKITDPKYKRVFEDKTTVILENTQVMPRVILYDNFEIEKNYENALKKLQEGFDFRNKVIINQDVPFNLQKHDSDKIKIDSYQATKVILSSQTADTVLGVLTDTYFPGWEVRIDGKKEQLLLADGIYRGVIIPKGNHKIEFIYEPDSFQLGLISSLGSLGVINFLFLFFKFKEKNL